LSAAEQLVRGVDFATVATNDFEQAAKFYGEVLGLPCTARYGRIPGGEFETGNLTLQLMEMAAIGREFTPNRNPIALHVDDFEAARAALEAKGVSFLSDTIDSGVCWMVPFEDPDGNVLMLHHRYAPRD
jgi:predicted enzyme related to lactoylglutathione lyase